MCVETVWAICAWIHEWTRPFSVMLAAQAFCLLSVEGADAARQWWSLKAAPPLAELEDRCTTLAKLLFCALLAFVPLLSTREGIWWSDLMYIYAAAFAATLAWCRVLNWAASRIVCRAIDATLYAQRAREPLLPPPLLILRNKQLQLSGASAVAPGEPDPSCNAPLMSSRGLLGQAKGLLAEKLPSRLRSLHQIFKNGPVRNEPWGPRAAAWDSREARACDITSWFADPSAGVQDILVLDSRWLFVYAGHSTGGWAIHSLDWHTRRMHVVDLFRSERQMLAVPRQRLAPGKHLRMDTRAPGLPSNRGNGSPHDEVGSGGGGSGSGGGALVVHEIRGMMRNVLRAWWPEQQRWHSLESRLQQIREHAGNDSGYMRVRANAAAAALGCVLVVSEQVARNRRATWLVGVCSWSLGQFKLLRELDARTHIESSDEELVQSGFGLHTRTVRCDRWVWEVPTTPSNEDERESTQDDGLTPPDASHDQELCNTRGVGVGDWSTLVLHANVPRDLMMRTSKYTQTVLTPTHTFHCDYLTGRTRDITEGERKTGASKNWAPGVWVRVCAWWLPSRAATAGQGGFHSARQHTPHLPLHGAALWSGAFLVPDATSPYDVCAFASREGSLCVCVASASGATIYELAAAGGCAKQQQQRQQRHQRQQRQQRGDVACVLRGMDMARAQLYFGACNVRALKGDEASLSVGVYPCVWRCAARAPGSGAEFEAAGECGAREAFKCMLPPLGPSARALEIELDNAFVRRPEAYDREPSFLASASHESPHVLLVRATGTRAGNEMRVQRMLHLPGCVSLLETLPTAARALSSPLIALLDDPQFYGPPCPFRAFELRTDDTRSLLRILSATGPRRLPAPLLQLVAVYARNH